ncbi:MAG: stage II sporulation protein M [Prevotella sp.]|nr:stage II sporulation protein M [Prevotella sp.]
MKEIQFIRRNIEKWKEMEETVETAKKQSPDRLADVYTELTSDLAFAQTHFPQSRITVYLNNLSSALHNEIYRNKREKWSRIVTFWTREMPDVMWNARHLLLASFVIFIASVAIGVVSTAGNADFPRVILGDFYVDMTLENIKNGTPMAVYDSDAEASMFLGITLNNIMVSFNIFIMGLFTSFFPGLLLMQNGIMFGSFETFFFQHGLLNESLLAVMLHGTLELSSIIVAGAAGLAMGNGWLFPDTYSRITSFQRGAKRGMKIIVGTIPLFMIAGFIESYVTRHTEINDILRLTIILLSAGFVVFYFVILPFKRNRQSLKQDNHAESETQDTSI